MAKAAGNSYSPSPKATAPVLDPTVNQQLGRLRKLMNLVTRIAKVTAGEKPVRIEVRSSSYSLV